MKIEHIGYIVDDPVQVAGWYVQHLGFRVACRQAERPFTHFLVDGAGQGVVEIYNYPGLAIPDYGKQEPLVLHLALDVETEPIEAVAERLLAAGATVAEALKTTEAGDRLLMLRDPWGFPIQLANRPQPLTGRPA